MNETVKTIIDKLNYIKKLCNDVETVIDIFQYNSIKNNTCNSVDYKQLKQDIRINTREIDNILEELNTKIFNHQLEKIKTNN